MAGTFGQAGVAKGMDLSDVAQFNIHLGKVREQLRRLLPIKAKGSTKRPDFLARLKKLYRGRAQKVTSAELLSEERDRS